MFPVLFQFFGFELPTYPVLVFIGAFIVAYVFSTLCLKKKLSLDLFTDHIYLFAISSFIFARIGGILELSSVYFTFPLRIFYFFDGAYNFYAALLGFLFTFFIVAYQKKENIWKWLDVIVPSLMGLFLFVALADFLAGKNYGIPSNLPWSVTFDIPEVRYTVPIHPVQLYEIVGILFVLLISYSFKRKYDGVMASSVFLGYFVLQALLSFFRGTPDTLFLGLKLSLILSVIFASISLIVFIIKTHPKIHLAHSE